MLALVVVLATYAVGRVLLTPRAALLGALVLATSPLGFRAVGAPLGLAGALVTLGVVGVARDRSILRVAGLALAGLGLGLAAHALRGGGLHAWSVQITAAPIVTQLGFGLFPWSALAPLVALGRAPGRTALLAWLAAAILVAVACAGLRAPIACPAAPPLALLLGVTLDRLLAREGDLLAALAVLLTALVLSHELLDDPARYLPR